MNVLQKAGRHGSYMTQFVRHGAPRRYPTRRDMRAAESRKSIERRLVLPLEHHHWMRALEVLQARYARLGRTAEHYQRVLRDMVNQTTPTKVNQESMAQAVHRIRDDAYAGDIPATATLWITLVWAYCTLDQPRAAWECFGQSQRRVQLSSGNTRHMATLLLPVLSQHGFYHEARQLADIILDVHRDSTTSHSSSGNTNRSNAAQDVADFSSLPPERDAVLREGSVVNNTCVGVPDEQHHANGMNNHATALHQCRHRVSVRLEEVQTVRRCLAEAAARSGDWRCAREWLSQLQQPTPLSSSPPDKRTTGKDERTTSSAPRCEPPHPPTLTLRTIDSLFLPCEEVARVHRTSSSGSTPAASASSALSLASVSTHGLVCPVPPDASPCSKRATSPLTHAWSALCMLSVPAVRALLHACCRDGSHDEARCCWRALHGSQGVCTGDRTDDDDPSSVGRCGSVPREDVLVFMNCLASAGLWRDVLHLFTTMYLCKSGRCYTDADEDTAARYDDDRHCKKRVTSKAESDGVDGGGSAVDPMPARIATLDEAALNLVFTSLGACDEERPTGRGHITAVGDAHESECAAAVTTERKQTWCSPTWPSLFARFHVTPVPRAGIIIRLLHDLLRLREDVYITDHLAATAVPALLQCGEDVARVRGLLVQTPMLSRRQARCAPREVSPAHRALQSRLVSLVYILHEMERTRAADAVALVHTHEGGRDGGGVGKAATGITRVTPLTPTMACLPHVFPPEAFQHAMPPVKRGAATATSASVSDTHTRLGSEAMRPVACTADVSDEERLRRQDAARPAHRLRPNRQNYFPPRSTALLAELQERQMRDDHVVLHGQRAEAFDGARDADADPRPIPKGLHDGASGWNFYGRGGEMVFSNSRRTAHPFSMWPKMMRAKSNPYRGWNPRQNSCIAHRENVKKWNGHSSV